MTPKLELPPEALPSLDVGGKALEFLANVSWWKQTFRCCVRFAPRCLLPAGLVTAANIGIIVLVGNIQQFLSSLSNSVADTALFTLIGTLLTAMLVTLICFGMILAGLTGWMMRLHVFARAFTLGGPGAAAPEFDEAKQYVASQQKFLFIFWLVASAYLLLPAMLMTMCIAGKVLVSPEIQNMSVNGELLFTAVDPEGLHRVNSLCAAGIPVFSIVVLAYTLVGIVYGAISGRSPGRLATRAFVDSVRKFPAVLLLTLIVSGINLLLASPFLAALWLFPKAQLDANVLFGCCMQLWLGATSTFIWPLSVAPFCMITSNGSRK